MPALGDERAVEVDQSNESVVLGERVIVKVFRHTRPGPQPAADLPAHLAAVGFTETPAPYGSVVWRDDTLVATAAAFVPEARDGWEWYVEMLASAVATGVWDAVDAVPAAIGGVAARFTAPWRPRVPSCRNLAHAHRATRSANGAARRGQAG